MSVVIETTIGDITVDLFTEERPIACLNFMKLCKLKYYNYNLFHTVEQGFIAQTGDPTGVGDGGSSVWGVVEGPHKRFFEAERLPKIYHSSAGLLSLVGAGKHLAGSQFFFTLADNLVSLDDQHCVIGEVVEGHETLRLLSEAIVDENFRPYQDIRITHTVILDDPFADPRGFQIPSRSPSPSAERLQNGRIAADEEIDDTEGKTMEELQEIMAEREAKARATILEIVGDLPDAEMAPPENVLFVCKLNQVTNDDDLEIIFSRFGKVKSCEVIRDKQTGDSLQYAFVEFEDQKACEAAYFKMDNVLIDDRRIHVDFSQSVAKVKWRGKGRGVEGPGGRIDFATLREDPGKNERIGNIRHNDNEKSYRKRSEDSQNPNNRNRSCVTSQESPTRYERSSNTRRESPKRNTRHHDSQERNTSNHDPSRLTTEERRIEREKRHRAQEKEERQNREQRGHSNRSESPRFNDRRNYDNRQSNAGRYQDRRNNYPVYRNGSRPREFAYNKQHNKSPQFRHDGSRRNFNQHSMQKRPRSIDRSRERSSGSQERYKKRHTPAHEQRNPFNRQQAKRSPSRSRSRRERTTSHSPTRRDRQQRQRSRSSDWTRDSRDKRVQRSRSPDLRNNARDRQQYRRSRSPNWGNNNRNTSQLHNKKRSNLEQERYSRQEASNSERECNKYSKKQFEKVKNKSDDESETCSESDGSSDNSSMQVKSNRSKDEHKKDKKNKKHKKHSKSKKSKKDKKRRERT